MPLFTPPTRTYVPRVLPSTPEWQQSPSKFFEADIPVGVNVWWSTANVISETQPAEAADVKKVWHGGRTHTITEDEAVILRAAGYTANIV